VALKNIKIMEREHLVERTATETGPYLAKALARLADHAEIDQLVSTIRIALDEAAPALQALPAKAA
jgi:adenosylmethionine-8-amino-7-oxononanoate aminotransferase